MNNSQSPIIYLLGAGRSGTTVLATVMNAHPKIQAVGELHQFFEHISGDKNCSCGNSLAACKFWGAISRLYKDSKEQLLFWKQICEEKEGHRKIPKYLLSKKESKEYSKIQERLFSVITVEIGNRWVLDSSKYIGRYLLLKRNRNLNVRGIYVVRDVRGVITSFNKQVQSSRTTLSAIFYYLMVNIAAQWVCWTDKGVIKVRYEDFMNDPEYILQQLCGQISSELGKPRSLPNKFEMPHIVGGNRMRSNRTIKLSLDEKWKKDLTKYQKILYYCLASPIMILNGYKL